MHFRMSFLLLGGAMLLAIAFLALSFEKETDISEEEALDIAIETYIYGYPLVTLDLTKQIMTNVTLPSKGRAPMGIFAHSRGYSTEQSKDVTAPNADMLYSTAWVDLAKEPYILHVPEEKGRYYLMVLFSGWSEVIANPGTRTTGTAAQDFAIVGPYWKGKLPEGVKEIKSPTNSVWIIGRTFCSGEPEDYKKVYAIQDQYSLTPLSYFGKPYKPSQAKIDLSIDMTTPVRSQVGQLSIEDYFKRLSSLMKDNPPDPMDASIIARMKKIGIVPGQDFNVDKLSPSVRKSLKSVVRLAIEEIKSQEENVGETVNGWVIALDTGKYGINYLQRAYIAAVGLGASLPEDTVYPMTQVDSDGILLNGDHKYVLHFTADELPPVKGFWSLTMYNDRYFFVDNPLNRYSVTPGNPLRFNADGSLDIYIQGDSPGKDKESNWLPSPKKDFILMMRLVWPDDIFWTNKWNPPAVVKAQ